MYFRGSHKRKRHTTKSNIQIRTSSIKQYEYTQCGPSGFWQNMAIFANGRQNRLCTVHNNGDMYINHITKDEIKPQLVGIHGEFALVRFLAALNENVFIIELPTGNLSKVNINTGRKRQLGSNGDFLDTRFLFAGNEFLYTLEEDALYRINPKDGKWKQIGKTSNWDETIAACTDTKFLYAVERSGMLYKIDFVNRGSWKRVGKQEFKKTKFMAKVRDKLYILETNGTLLAVNPNTGTKKVVAKYEEFTTVEHMVSCAGNIFVIDDKGTMQMIKISDQLEDGLSDDDEEENSESSESEEEYVPKVKRSALMRRSNSNKPKYEPTVSGIKHDEDSENEEKLSPHTNGKKYKARKLTKLENYVKPKVKASQSVAESFCDTEVIIGSSHVFCHSSVLSRMSKVFRQSLVGLRPSDCKATKEFLKLELNEKPEIMLNILRYLYTTHIEVTDENVKDILEIAAKYEINDLCKQCLKHMDSTVDASSQWDIIRLAKSKSLETVRNKFTKLILQDFMENVKNSSFKKESFENIKELINSDELAVVSEEFVYNAAMDWIKYDLENRKKHLDDILRCIRFPLIKQEQLATLDQSVAESSSIFTGLLLDAFKHHSDPQNSEIKCGSRIHKLQNQYSGPGCSLSENVMREVERLGGRPRLRITRVYKTCTMVMPIPFGIQYFVDILFPKDRAFCNEKLKLSNITFTGELEIPENLKSDKFLKENADAILIGKASPDTYLAALMMDAKQTDFKVYFVGSMKHEPIALSSFLAGCTVQVI